MPVISLRIVGALFAASMWTTVVDAQSASCLSARVDFPNGFIMTDDQNNRSDVSIRSDGIVVIIGSATGAQPEPRNAAFSNGMFFLSQTFTSGGTFNYTEFEYSGIDVVKVKFTNPGDKASYTAKQIQRRQHPPNASTVTSERTVRVDLELLRTEDFEVAGCKYPVQVFSRREFANDGSSFTEGRFLYSFLFQRSLLWESVQKSPGQPDRNFKTRIVEIKPKP